MFVPGQVHDGHDRAVDHAARLGDLRTPADEVFQSKLFYLAESISTIQLYKNMRSIKKYSIGENFNKIKNKYLTIINNKIK